MLKKSASLGLAIASALLMGHSYAAENEVLLNFNGQANTEPSYTSSKGTMTVNPPGVGNFSVTTADHTMTINMPGGGVTTVITPSASAVPTKIAVWDQRASTSRNISAICMNPTTLADEPCNFGDAALFPWTDHPPSAYPYTQLSDHFWNGNALTVSTPGTPDLQSNGGYITLPPYVRQITVTAFGSASSDFSALDILMADAPSISKAFAPNAVVPGGQSTLTISVKNPDLGAPIPALAVTDVLPAPLTVVSATHTCTGGVLTAAAGTNTISLNDATLPTDGCQITAVVAWPGDAGGISACTANPTVTNRITPSTQFTTAVGQLDTEAVAELNCSYTPPVITTPTAVPTLGEWTLVMLTSLMALLGVTWLRRRQG